MNIKNIFSLLFASIAILAFNISNAQTPVELHITHKISGQAFSSSATGTNNLNNSFNVSRLEYYISKISITHDGGMVTDVPDHYILANGNQAVTDALGSFNITSVEAVSFYIGVDSPANHEDPSLRPSNHPLAPKSPSMHWGWAAGYRFVAMEGKSGSSLTQDYQVHALGNNNYNKVTVAVNGVTRSGKIIIPLNADYATALKDIDVSAGLTTHGDFGEAVTLLNNFSTEVFSAGFPATVEETLPDQRIVLYPNPSKGWVNVDLGNLRADVIVSDIQGRIVEEIEGATNIVSVHITKPGMYFLKMRTNDGNLSVQKLQIL